MTRYLIGRAGQAGSACAGPAAVADAAAAQSVAVVIAARVAALAPIKRTRPRRALHGALTGMDKRAEDMIAPL